MATTDSKPTLATLKTPLSATYPSELRSPMVHSATTPTTFIKREEAMKTPITPPSAYLDFLKTLSPVVMSPMSTGTSSKFVFEANRPTSTASVTSSASSASFTSTSAPADKNSPTSPASSRASSCCNCDHAKQEPPKSAPPTKVEAVTIPPPSPFTRPQSARTPRLYIPQSPYSPASVRSPASAYSAGSPYSAVSPKTWDPEKKSSRARRAPAFPQIDPAPRGKRRKIE
ncbi:hypothetical protein EJ04DRAFT_46542 [Polyplosphaeria fusca]|uniref:Uncharacterized protein n=1 Tax=Polyplosphaeria fusca TaxID=682080 RepID=A0A9P4UVX0_9PLEO|nr:hypothetical protein EJ04DRAFT_46542 [Polyplosphaeria fusca]